MASQVVRKLEAKGLLDREVDPGDTRASRLRLTPEGADLARQAITVVEEVDAQFFEADAATITPLLQRLIERAPARPQH
jgi:DNA-binding MarR family transcriptional regulator